MRLSPLLLTSSVLFCGCTTIEYGKGRLSLESEPKSGTSDPTNHSLDLQRHSASDLELSEIRLLDKTGAGCAMGATMGSATAARDKALKDSPNAPVVTYKYKVYDSDEVAGSHCGVIYREAKGDEIENRGDATVSGEAAASVTLREYGFNLRNGYEYGNLSLGVEIAAIFGKYSIPSYPINYYDPVGAQFYPRTAKVSKSYAVVPLEVFAGYSPEFLFGVGVFANAGISLATYTDPKYAYGVMYSFGLGDYWLLQARLRMAHYTAKIVGEVTKIDETLASLGLSYLFGEE